MNFPKPPDEEERLRALRRYDILDTPPELVFERITQLVARLLHVPIALISLIDAERQWFKSCYGLDLRQTDRQLAFCAHALLADEVMVVPDATRDPRFVGNALVTGPPHIRFYAGAPLKTPDGFHLGTLCAIGTVPRTLSDDEKATLADLAAVVVDELELRQAANKIRAEVTERRRAEEALRKSEERLRDLFEKANDVIYLADADGRVTFFNPTAVRLMKYTPEELRGMRYVDLVAPAYREAAKRFYGRQFVRKTPDTYYEFPALAKDGAVVWFGQNVHLLTHHGEITGFQAVARDITERKRAEEALRQSEERLRLLESVVVTANDAILITEAEPVEEPGPRILYVNEAFSRMTGYRPEEVLGKTPRLLQGPKTARAPRDKIRKALARWRPVVVELMNYRKDGSEFWVELSIVPVADETGWFTHWVSVQRDISGRKQTEAALQGAKEEAERANHAKSEFLSRMSHELRTPMNAILGFAQLLEMGAVLPEDRECVGQILKAGRHLLGLINEVLDISRIEAGRLALSPEPVLLSEILGEVVDLVRPLAARRRVRLGEPGAAWRQQHVLADRQRLKQVLLNLLDNAVKYNREGGAVTLTCEETPGSRLRLKVSDTGPGIPPEKQERLFTPFDRLGAEQTETEGTGLGLALSRRLMEAMGGSLRVESAPDQGSTFCVELPRAQDPLERLERLGGGGRALAPAEGGPPTAARTLLYIEDNLSNLRLVERVLIHRPRIRLLAAMQGELGLNLAREHRPDLIVLDLHLPDMHGEDVLRRLRDDARTRDIPVMVVSADATPGRIERLQEAGATSYLTKPFDVSLFLQAVDRALQEGAAQRERKGSLDYA